MNMPGALLEPQPIGSLGDFDHSSDMCSTSTRPQASASLPVEGGEVELSVIIVNYNVREFLEQALRSVDRAGRHLSMEVFVVDNSSVDGSVTMIREEFPHVRLIANTRNVGFSRANNQAIRQARGHHLLILNPDTIVQEDTLETLLRFMEEHPDAGAVGCKILHPDGRFARESRRAFPTPEVAFYRLVGLASLFPSSRRFGRYNMTYLPEDQVAEVDALSGSCMLVRKDALYRSADGAGAGAGLLDEDFFMYGEDLDWCYRIQQAGWKIYYTPETQIIHYKGESTKKGELRYVRLFYGAMMRFTEKHFEYRYPGLLSAMLRLGILFRASLSVAGKAARRLLWPVIDFLLVYASASVIAIVHAAALDARPAPLFFAVVATMYSLGAVAGIGLSGGYGRTRRLRSVWIGVFIGLLVVAALSFFLKDIAFSRMVVLLTFPVGAGLASVARLIAARTRRRDPRSNKAVLVGHLDEAVRLRQMLARHPAPPFTLAGYVAVADPAARNGRLEHGGVDLLGGINQLRDLVRLGDVQDVIFASAALSNQTIFSLIQQLRDLNVQFRILAEGRDHVIGKASVDDLSMANLLKADAALVDTRSYGAERAFDVALAAVGLVLHPFVVAVAAVAGRDSFPGRLAERTRQMPRVLTGERSIVGYDPTGRYRPPAEWQLRPGVFPVSDVLDLQPGSDGDIGTAYWFYVRNQSGSLDWDIVVRSLRLLRARSRAPLNEAATPASGSRFAGTNEYLDGARHRIDPVDGLRDDIPVQRRD